MFAISGCSMEAPVTYKISKSIENKYIESAYRMYDVGGVSLTCSSCINSFNKSSNSFLNGQILYWMIKSFIKWLIGSLNHQASPSQPTVESGYKPDTNRIQKSCQATPQGTPGHPRPPQTIPRSSPAPPGHPRPKASKVCKSINMENTSYDGAPGDTKSSKCLVFYCKIDNVLYEVGIAIVDCSLFWLSLDC